MKGRYILLLGVLGSIIMAVMDYTGTISVENWFNLIPFGISVLIVIAMKGGHDFIDAITDAID